MKAKLNTSSSALSYSLVIAGLAAVSFLSSPHVTQAQTSNEEGVFFETQPIAAPSNVLPKPTSELYTAPKGTGLKPASEFLSAPSEEPEAPSAEVLRGPSSQGAEQAPVSELYTAPTGDEPQSTSPILKAPSEAQAAEEASGPVVPTDNEQASQPKTSVAENVITAPSAKELEPRHSEIITSPREMNPSPSASE